MKNLTYRFMSEGRRFEFDGERLSIHERIDGDALLTQQASNRSVKPTEKTLFLRSIALNITNTCNLRCGYCYANQGGYDRPGIAMSHETARAGVDMVIDSAVKNGGDTVTIGFFGGEPLLAFPLIRDVVAYTNSVAPKGVSVRYMLTTNGTLVTPEHVALMSGNRFHVTVSIDGDADVHDTQRVYPNGSGSHADASRGFRRISEAMPTTVRMTVTDTNPHVDRAVGHILELGARRMTYALDYRMTDVAHSAFMDSLGLLFDRYRRSVVRQEYFDLTNITVPIAAIVLKQKRRAHCNAGISYLSVSADGRTYRCPRFTGNLNFSLGLTRSGLEGRVAEGLETFRTRLSNDARSRSVVCSKCEFVHLCGGACYHHAHAVHGSEFTPVPRECAHRKFLFKETLRLLCALSKQERRDFLLYLSALWRKERR